MEELTVEQVSTRWEGSYFYFEVTDEDLDKEIVEVVVTPEEQGGSSLLKSFFG
jgi:hypothetical protein